MNFKVREGDYTSLGARIQQDGIMFTFEGEKEDKCCIVLVDKKDGTRSRVEVDKAFCLGSLRSVLIHDIRPEKYDYLYERNGVEEMDPYATAIRGREKWNALERQEKENQLLGGFAGVDFDWEGDVPPEVSKQDMVMYKLHIRGFSMDSSMSKRKRGTFAAVEERLDYIKDLGATTVELMPIYEFEEIKRTKKDPLPDYISWEEAGDDIIRPGVEDSQTALNYWGYGIGNYFAVKASYAVDPRSATFEFKHLVKEMHSRGLECVMEMYFPTEVNHNLIVDALRYWVRVYHVDGFHLLGEDLPITAIVQDAMLSRTKIMYTEFSGASYEHGVKYNNLYVYKEEYQYPARKIMNHISGDMVEFSNQQKKQGIGVGFINFISSNNGFSLADIFMYNDRHNEANGENNEDGNPWNFSNNCGVEGPTRKKFVNATRQRQWRNAILALYMAQGVPMLWAGDEMQNSQKGNNNAYCQDNEIGWLNWKNEKQHKDCIAFVRAVAQFRRAHSILSQSEPFRFSDYRSLGMPDLSFHGENAWISGIDIGRMSIGMLYNGAYGDKEQEDVYVAYNFFSAVSTLALPRLNGKKKWYLAIDSSKEEVPIIDEPSLLKNQQAINLNPQSICVLVGR